MRPKGSSHEIITTRFVRIAARLGGTAACLSLALGLCSALAAAATYHVSPDGSGDFRTIQEALDAAVDGDEIVLANGTFQGPGNRGLRFRGKSIVVRSESGDPATCIIDPEVRDWGFVFDAGESANARVEGVTVTRARSPEDTWEGYGGGVFCYGSAPTLQRCAFTECAAEYGGGICVVSGSPVIQECSFYWCGMIIGGSTGGGAIYARESDLQIEDCTFDSCFLVYGGALWTDHCTVRVDRSLFRANLGIHGSALWCQDVTDLHLASCTFLYNLGEDAQIGLWGGSRLTADQTILAYTNDSEKAVVCDATSTASLSCCDVYGNAGGDWVGCLAGQESVNHNLWADPIFCSLDDLDPHLRSDSPCAAENNADCGQIGACGVACDAPTAMTPSSWGRMKASFR